MQIRNVGKMWRVMHGEITLAFATNYRMALHRRNELFTQRAADRVIHHQQQRRAQQCNQ